MTKVAVFDPQEIVRGGVAQLLRMRDVDVVAEAGDEAELLAVLDNDHPEVVLGDFAASGGKLIAAVVEKHPEVAVIVLTSLGERSSVLAALNSGASGYLLKDDEPDDLARGVRAAARGEVPLSPKAARILMGGPAGLHLPTKLTRREHDVLQLLSEGLSNKAMARRLGISEKTVKAHLSAAFRRIGAEDRTQAALWFLSNSSTSVISSTNSRPRGS